MFKVNKVKVKTPDRRHSPRSDVFIVNFTYLTLYTDIMDLYLSLSFLENFSTKRNAHPLASLSKQDMFIKNFNANCNTNFFISFLSFDK